MGQLRCVRCKERVVVTGRSACEECLEKQREYSRKRREILKSKNICDRCGKNQRKKDSIYCEVCLDINNNRIKLKRDKNRENNECIICGVFTENKSRCEVCVKKASESEFKLRELRKTVGVCIKCSKATVPPHVKCNDCLSKQSTQWREKVEEFAKNGLCVGCGKLPLENNKLCEICYLKKVATKRIGSSNRWKEIKEIYGCQNGVCPYTGIFMTLGKNADLDHIIPVNKGGSNERDNLQWVYHPINIMKWDNLEKDFLNLVQLVYEHRLNTVEASKYYDK